MEEKILLAELMKNCNVNGKKVVELLVTYDLAELGYKLQEERENDIRNRVLSESEYFAGEDCPWLGINSGDRITLEQYTFLLGEEDWAKYQKASTELSFKEGLTDEYGYYVERWSDVRCAARNELVRYIIDNIVPKEIRGIFDKNFLNITMQDKLIGITRDAFCKKSA